MSTPAAPLQFVPTLPPEEVARAIYAPVMRAHRVTVEQMAILEPALSETVGATFALSLRDAVDEDGAGVARARACRLGRAQGEEVGPFGQRPHR